MNEYNNPKKEYISLADLPNNEEGLISRINGGWGIRNRLNGMGINIGDKVERVYHAPFSGPVKARINNQMNVAFGRGMAMKIIVEYIKNETK